MFAYCLAAERGRVYFCRAGEIEIVGAREQQRCNLVLDHDISIATKIYLVREALNL